MDNIPSIQEFILKDDLITEMYTRPYVSSLKSKNKYKSPDEIMRDLLYEFKKIKGLYIDLRREGDSIWNFQIYNVGKYENELLGFGTRGELYQRMESMMDSYSMDSKNKPISGMKEMGGHLFEVKLEKNRKKLQLLVITLKKENYKMIDDKKTVILQELNVDMSQLIKKYSKRLIGLDSRTVRELNRIFMDFRDDVDDLSGL